MDGWIVLTGVQARAGQNKPAGQTVAGDRQVVVRGRHTGERGAAESRSERETGGAKDCDTNTALELVRPATAECHRYANV